MCVCVCVCLNQEEIQRLIQSQDLNRAFEMALSTSDLSLVLYLCQRVGVEDVFDKTPCPLSQPVLLSLIQQFSVDLSDHMELKLRSVYSRLLSEKLLSIFTLRVKPGHLT